MTDSNNMDNSTLKILKDDFNEMIAGVYAFVKTNKRDPLMVYIVTGGVKTKQYLTTVKYNKLHIIWTDFIRDNGRLPNYIVVNSTVDDGWRYVPSFVKFTQINGYDCGPTSLSMGLTEMFPGSGDRQIELEKYAGTTTGGTSHAGLEKAFLKEMELKGLKGEYYEKNVSDLTLTQIGDDLEDADVFIIAHGNTKGWSSYWKNAYGHYVYPVGVNIKTGQFKIADPTKGLVYYSRTEWEAGLKLIVGQKSYLFFKADR